MTERIDNPERRHVIEIKIGADSEDDLIHELKSILFDFTTRGISHHSVSGGYSTGHIIEYRINENVTHGSFVEALNEYRCSLENYTLRIHPEKVMKNGTD